MVLFNHTLSQSKAALCRQSVLYNWTFIIIAPQKHAATFYFTYYHITDRVLTAGKNQTKFTAIFLLTLSEGYSKDHPKSSDGQNIIHTGCCND